LVNRPGELACARCGTVLATGGTTRKLGAPEEPPSPVSWPTGEVIVTDQEPIILQIGADSVTVPVAEVVTIGRSSDIPDDTRPDVDLGPFGAGDQGVSRKHIKIKRKNILVYVTDLGSTNGTLLNGRRLIPNAERLLRNGDELQLGRLKIKVKF
jgi:pSer/pThr/pTyr-binding forkhead associated (FHA) protein